MMFALALTAYAAPEPAPPTPPVPVLAPDAPVPPVAPVAPPVPPVLPVPPVPVTKFDERVKVTERVGDLFAMGQSVEVANDVGDNAFLMGQEVEVNSPVDGDIYAMSSELRVDAPVNGDVYGLAAEVELTEAAVVFGNVRLAGGSVELSGAVSGSVDIAAGELVLDAPIRGSLDADFERLELGGNARIDGDLAYSAPERLPDLEARVAGAIDFTEHVVQVEEPSVVEEAEEESSILAEAVWWGSMRTWGFFTKLMLGALFLLIGGAPAARIGRRIASHPGESVGSGFVVASVLPVASFLALITIAPFPLGVVGFVLFALLLYIGQIFAAQAIGDRLLRQFRPEAVGSPYLSLAVGLVPFILLVAIPWVGSVAWFVATLAGIGGLWAVIRGKV